MASSPPRAAESLRKRKSTDDGNESPNKGKARLAESQDDGQTGDRLTASVETPHKVPRSLKSKVAQVTRPVENSPPTSDEEERDEVDYESNEGSQDQGYFSTEIESLIATYGFPTEWLESIAINCSQETADVVVSLCRLLEVRREQLERLKLSLSVFGIAEPQWVKEGDQVISDPRFPETPVLKRSRKQATPTRTTVAVATSKLERLPTLFNETQIASFCDHLRSCFLNNVDDQRESLLSEPTMDLLGSMLLAQHHISEFQEAHREWLRWDGPMLAEKLASCFCGGNEIATSTIDWRALFERDVPRPVINVRDRTSYLPYVQKINQVRAEASNKSSSEEAIVKLLISKLAGGEESSSIPRANKTLQSRLRSSDSVRPILRIKDYVVRLLGVLESAVKTVDEADQWEERQVAAPSGNKNGRQPKQTGDDPKQSHHCEGCGAEAKKAGWQQCIRCAGHPDRNPAGPWEQSATFKALRSRLPNVPKPVLSQKRRANGEPLTEAHLKAMQQQADAIRSKASKPHKGKKGESLLNLLSTDYNNALIPCKLFLNDSNY